MDLTTSGVTDRREEAAIDLNSDLGESLAAWTMGDDESMLDVVSSANIACAFHAGDPLIMSRAVAAAVERDVRIGAHVAYPDREGFGRRPMQATSAQITADVLYQIGALDGIARACGTRVRYVKPHGALYNTMAVDEATARAVVEAVLAYDPTLPLLTLSGSVAVAIAEQAGLPVFTECFADRAYTPDGRLVPRSEPGAVVDDPQAVVLRALQLAGDGSVVAADGSTIPVRAASMCVHGDTPGAAELASQIRKAFHDADITVAPFA